MHGNQRDSQVREDINILSHPDGVHIQKEPDIRHEGELPMPRPQRGSHNPVLPRLSGHRYAGRGGVRGGEDALSQLGGLSHGRNHHIHIRAYKGAARQRLPLHQGADTEVTVQERRHDHPQPVLGGSPRDKIPDTV